MKRNLILFVAFLFPMAAFGGKEERDYLKDKVAPAIADTQSGVKTSCGCALKITLDEKTNPTVKDMGQAEYFLSDVKAGAAKYCTGPAEKKAICKMKSLKIVKGKETAFTFSGSAGVATTDGQMNVMFDNIARQLDK